MVFRNGVIKTRRAGKTLAESAIVYSLAMLLLMGTMVTGLGVFRYQQIAQLAQLGARWAAVHGSTYQTQQGKSAPTSATVLSTVITPNAIAMNPSNLTCNLVMTATTATLTVSYVWTPEAFVKPVTFSSTAVVPITY